MRLRRGLIESEFEGAFERRQMWAPLIVGVGGTARPQSTSELAVMYALRTAEGLGAQTKLFDGNFVSNIPLYVPGRSMEAGSPAEFIGWIRKCDGLIVATPGYHGSLSGPIKNALDWIEETCGDVRPYLDGRSFGCIVTSYGWQACGTTLLSLRVVAHALRAWPTPFGATLNSSAPLFSPDGGCAQPGVADQISRVARQVVEFARWKSSSDLG